MIIIRSQGRGLLIECKGVFIDGNRSDYDHRTAIKGFISSVKDPVILGYYDTSQDAGHILDQIQESIHLGETIFEMPSKEI
jgi:hypothetical protein